jgi:hypothetical protein
MWSTLTRLTDSVEASWTVSDWAPKGDREQPAPDLLLDPRFAPDDPQAGMQAREGILDAATDNCIPRAGEEMPDWDWSPPFYSALPQAANSGAFLGATGVVADQVSGTPAWWQGELANRHGQWDRLAGGPRGDRRGQGQGHGRGGQARVGAMVGVQRSLRVAVQPAIVFNGRITRATGGMI